MCLLCSDKETKLLLERLEPSEPAINPPAAGAMTDGARLRHLLISLRLFRVDKLFSLTADIAAELVGDGVLLNMTDKGIEEALTFYRGDLAQSEKFLDSMERMNIKPKWIPTLEELMLCRRSIAARFLQLSSMCGREEKLRFGRKDDVRM